MSEEQELGFETAVNNNTAFNVPYSALPIDLPGQSHLSSGIIRTFQKKVVHELKANPQFILSQVFPVECKNLMRQAKEEEECNFKLYCSDPHRTTGYVENELQLADKYYESFKLRDALQLEREIDEEEKKDFPFTRNNKAITTKQPDMQATKNENSDELIGMPSDLNSTFRMPALKNNSKFGSSGGDLASIFEPRGKLTRNEKVPIMARNEKRASAKRSGNLPNSKMSGRSSDQKSNLEMIKEIQLTLHKAEQWTVKETAKVDQFLTNFVKKNAFIGKLQKIEQSKTNPDFNNGIIEDEIKELERNVLQKESFFLREIKHSVEQSGLNESKNDESAQFPTRIIEGKENNSPIKTDNFSIAGTKSQEIVPTTKFCINSKMLERRAELKKMKSSKENSFEEPEVVEKLQSSESNLMEPLLCDSQLNDSGIEEGMILSPSLPKEITTTTSLRARRTKRHETKILHVHEEGNESIFIDKNSNSSHQSALNSTGNSPSSQPSKLPTKHWPGILAGSVVVLLLFVAVGIFTYCKTSIKII